jgi:hypothetical protein
MLMRYTVVTLLLAALAASAVRAQSPRRESPSSSSQSKGQGQGVEVPVTPQPDAPLRISVRAGWIAEIGWLPGYSGYWMRTSVENVSQRDIGLYTIRRAAVGTEKFVAIHAAGHSQLPGFMSPGKALRPGQVDVIEGKGLMPESVFPRLGYEVESVVFTDGTVWCTDECRLANHAAGQLAGMRAFVGRLMRVLETGGLDAVINTLREKVAEDDPEPAVTVTTGELVDIKPPSGHTTEWEYAFREITKSIADGLWEQYALHGTGHIEQTIRDVYRVAETK